MALSSRWLTRAVFLLLPGFPAATSAQAPAVMPAAPKLQIPAPTAAPAADPPTGEITQGAMQVADLLVSLARFDQNGRVTQRIGFEIPERAVNEYLAYSLRNRPRPGISSIRVTLLPKNDIAATVEIDFSSVLQWNPEILPEPLRPLLSGKLTVQLNAHFESGNGTFNLTLKDAHGPDGKILENQIVSALMQAIGSHQPESYDAARPITLPFGLKRVWTDKQSLQGET